MSTVQQNDTPSQPEALQMVSFKVPADFKLALDRQVTEERTTLREFCTRVLAEKLGIAVPGEESAQPESRKRKAS